MSNDINIFSGPADVKLFDAVDGELDLGHIDDVNVNSEDYAVETGEGQRVRLSDIFTFISNLLQTDDTLIDAIKARRQRKQIIDIQGLDNGMRIDGVYPCVIKNRPFKGGEAHKITIEAKTAIEKEVGHFHIIRDKDNRPNYMFYLPRFNWDPVNRFASTEVFPAFIVDGENINGVHISQYPNILINPADNSVLGDTNPSSSSEPYVAGSAHSYIAQSLPFYDPRVKIDWDAANKACVNMNKSGESGFHMLSNPEWAALAWYCHDNNIQPFGNNSYGRETSNPAIVGKMANGNNLGGPSPSRILGGSAGRMTSHNREVNGIFDLNGNIWEWVSGLKLIEGKIYVHGDLNTAPIAVGNSFNALEADWFDTGYYVNYNAGTGVTSLSAVNRGDNMSPTPDYTSLQFNNLGGGNASLMKLIVGLITAPGDGSYGSDITYWRNHGMRFPFRGGNWDYAADAGVFALSVADGRASRGWNIGFRSAFVHL